MSDKTLGVPQRAWLLALMAVGGEATNPDLKSRFGLELQGKPRDTLTTEKLVVADKSVRPFRFELTDAGWRWCEEELTSPPPRRAGSMGGALYAVLAGIGSFFERSDLRLADVFGTVTRAPAGASVVRPVAAEDVDELVRTAYRKLAPHPRAWVGLADLRPLLGDAAREDVDAALKRLFRTPEVNLVPESNQKALGPDDRAAAIRIGGEDKHLISIEAT